MNVSAIEWSDKGLRLLDQRRLPVEETWLTLEHSDQVANAIRDMVVRGAPAIGITAAYGVVLAARDALGASGAGGIEALRDAMQRLGESRPTAVNLRWALQRMGAILDANTSDPIAALLQEARTIHDNDIKANKCMGTLGAELIESGQSVLTHCNTGALATGGYGTALGVIRSAWACGKLAQVYAGETRPWLQGARLTAWELVKESIPVKLIVEGAAAHLMRCGHVHWVIVGADRIAANGDVANKIGTYQLALAARAHDIGFMVVAPCSTIDMNTPDGESIPIEQREPAEILQLGATTVAAHGADAWNPAFDITPAAFVDAIVTENGVVKGPDSAKIAALMRSTDNR